ncbi:uncharacterized protein LOC143425728 [Xylocopa sonorina]|uniref:uncharacterized protein LOC143425728 n=1 Tax=Xylocopa sonorina TaxID=1818115 RepID=UPI00403B02B4
MPQAVKTRTGKKNAGTQTREIDTVLEIARLQEQVKLLTIENEHLRKYNVENISDVLKPVSSVSVDNAETPKRSERMLQNQSIQQRSAKTAMRGCACKGKCSSKQCGCVKKDSQCGKWCKCDDAICKNKENEGQVQNKENLYHNESMPNQQVVNKRFTDIINRKGLFSPDTPTESKAFNVEPLSPVVFDSSKKLTFDADDEKEVGDVSKQVGKESIENNKIAPKNITQRRDRVKRNNLKAPSQYVRKLRSSSNEEILRESDSKIEKQTLRRCSSSEIETDESKQIMKRTNNYIQNVAQGMTSLRLGQKKFKTRAKKTVTNDNSNSKGEKLKYKKASSIPVEDNTKVIVDNVATEVSESPKEQQTASHNTNESFNIVEDHNNDFNPMRPKHELLRTPVHDNDKTRSHSMSSDISLLTSTDTAKEEGFEISAELSQAEVNWEEYQAQLVPCSKCKRKFHPCRIKKHESCCKMI